MSPLRLSPRAVAIWAFTACAALTACGVLIAVCEAAAGRQLRVGYILLWTLLILSSGCTALLASCMQNLAERLPNIGEAMAAGYKAGAEDAGVRPLRP
jgi:hypothetical protein